MVLSWAASRVKNSLGLGLDVWKCLVFITGGWDARAVVAGFGVGLGRCRSRAAFVVRTWRTRCCCTRSTAMSTMRCCGSARNVRLQQWQTSASTCIPFRVCRRNIRWITHEMFYITAAEEWDYVFELWLKELQTDFKESLCRASHGQRRKWSDFVGDLHYFVYFRSFFQDSLSLGEP